MKLKLLSLGLGAVLIAAALGTACTVGDVDDVNVGGFGGEGGSDTASGGASSSGGSDVGGQGGQVAELDCTVEGTISGTAGSSEPTVDAGDDSYACQVCINTWCDAPQSACNATGPETSCASGSVAGATPGEGEASCMQLCLIDRATTQGVDFLGSEDDLAACSNECGAIECGGAEASLVTQDLFECMLGLSLAGHPEGCMAECITSFVP